GLSPTDALRAAERMLRERRSTSLRGELARYAVAAAALDVAAAEGPSQGERARSFYTEATRCLRRVGIGRRGSRLSELYATLEDASPARSAAPAYERLLDCGQEVCLRLLEEQLARGTVALHLAGARVLRLGGRFDEARARLERVRGEEHAILRAWEL